jgi:DNA-binding NarL/FixJ family response regulator
LKLRRRKTNLGPPHIHSHGLLREDRNDSCSIAIAQNSDPEFAQAALSNGAAGYVLKTDAGRELLSAIESVLRGEIFVSSGIESWDSKGQLSERY